MSRFKERPVLLALIACDLLKMRRNQLMASLLQSSYVIVGTSVGTSGFLLSLHEIEIYEKRRFDLLLFKLARGKSFSLALLHQHWRVLFDHLLRLTFLVDLLS